MFTFLKSKVWRWAIGAFLVARVAYSLWAVVVIQLNPMIVSNLDLFGAPVVAAFNLQTSAHSAFSRLVDGRKLHFRAAPPNMMDTETGTVWGLDGSAVSGTLVGAGLQSSLYTTEDVFPYRGVAPTSNILLSPWQRFDTNWYVKIAERGYSAEDGSTVYFPLYPLLIRVVGTVLLGQYLFAALLISNLAVIGVFYAMYQIANGSAGPDNAARTVAFLAIFPTGFFLFGAYTESLFLLFALLSLREGTQAHWGRAATFGALAALTRLQGVLLVVPLAYLWRSERRGAGDASAIAQQGSRGPLPFRWFSDGGGLGWALMLIAIPLATGAFLIWQYLFVGNASLVGAYEGQLHARFVMPWENVAASFALIAGAQASFVDILNLLVTILFGVMIAVIWFRRCVPRAFVLYAALMYLAPMFRMTTTQPLVSMARYVVVLFPVFMAWGAWGRNAWVNRAIVYLSFPLSLYLSAQFVMWGWVG